MEETKGLVGLTDWSRVCGVRRAQNLNEELTKINIKRKLKLITTSRMVQTPETKTKRHSAVKRSDRILAYTLFKMHAQSSVSLLLAFF